MEKNLADLQFLYDILATASKDLQTIHARMDGQSGVLLVGIGARHLSQTVDAIAAALATANSTPAQKALDFEGL